MSTLGWISVGVSLAVWLVAWTVLGLGRGRAYGSRLADYLGWKRNFFHTVLDLGTNNGTLMLLSGMEKSGASHHQATVSLAPYLSIGLQKLEARFGAQQQIVAAWPTVEGLVKEWEKTQG